MKLGVKSIQEKKCYLTKGFFIGEDKGKIEIKNIYDDENEFKEFW
jgi:hypothetical protein